MITWYKIELAGRLLGNEAAIILKCGAGGNNNNNNNESEECHRFFYYIQHVFIHASIHYNVITICMGIYPRRARSALGVDTVFTLDVCLYVCMYVSSLERKRLIGMT